MVFSPFHGPAGTFTVCCPDLCWCGNRRAKPAWSVLEAKHDPGVPAVVQHPIGGTMKEKTRFWIVAFLLALAFDMLFWGVDHGINFPLFALFCMAGGLFVLHQAGHRPARSVFLLLLPLGFFALGSWWRLEPLAHVVSCAWVLFFMGLFAVSYAWDGWWAQGPRETLRSFASLLATALSHGIAGRSSPGTENTGAHPEGTGRLWLPALWRGLLLALPIAGLFALLLARADAVFAHYITSWFSFRTLAEVVFRLSYILVGAYLLMGVFTHVVRESEKRHAKPSPAQSVLSPLLGGVEANVVLAVVDALFFLFVLVQLRYFFAGKTNLEALGLTYSEYARRGFGELLAVAFLSLVLTLALQGSVQTLRAGGQRVFQVLSLLLLLLVGAILLSAFQRLGLYQEAYGFTRARLYAHTLMVWIGVALLAVAGLQATNARRWVAHALLVAAVGFSAHLVLSNVDARVVKNNVARAASGAPLDVAYLASLSSDAVPVMAGLFRNPGLPETTREAVGALLLCWTVRHPSWDSPVPWQEFHLSRWRARQALGSALPQLAGYHLDGESKPTTVRAPSSRTFPCLPPPP